ncbi:MAG: DNA/RNA nuclease SfsA [Tissierellia bacterium]|nr:DNA/RNA nuclease SfsA [Tissierellia bacterium]
MKFEGIVEGTFLRRPNRFIAHCLVEGKEIVAHVPNTGRLKEILVEGNRAILLHRPSPHRKTAYSLIGAYKKEDNGKETLIYFHSHNANDVIEEALRNKKIPSLTSRKDFQWTREKEYKNSHGKSRFDFHFSYTEGKEKKEGYIEIKGVTLVEGKKALFPDAPTERGARHLEHLSQAKEEGKRAIVLFLIQLQGPKTFHPNRKRDPFFGEMYDAAKKAGVEIWAYDSKVTENSIELGKELPVE